MLWLYPLAVATLLVFTLAVTLWVAALNVRYRDVQHLLNLGLLVWFWITPIVYPSGLVQQYLDRGKSPVAVEPVPAEPARDRSCSGSSGRCTASVSPRRRRTVLPDVSLAVAGRHAAARAGACSLLLLSYTWRLFFRLSGDFAEEL